MRPPGRPQRSWLFPARLAFIGRTAVLLELLPKGVREISAKDVAMLEKLFGVRGKIPAMKMETGELRI